MIRRPPRSTRTDTLVPYTTLFRSRRGDDILAGHGVGRGTRHWLAAADQVDAQRSVAAPVIARVIVVAARYILGLDHATLRRSEARRVGKECVSTCRYRWSQDH